MVEVSALYLDLGDELRDAAQRRAAYEEGARVAERALELEPTAQAHYLYAANLGSAAQMTGVMASAWRIQEIKSHVKQALALNPKHAPALHMMGMMLEELPWVLGGDAAAALAYLRRAVAADPGYEHARLDLAKAYLKRGDATAARQELRVLVENSAGPAPVTPSRHAQEARQLLDSLP